MSASTPQSTVEVAGSQNFNLIVLRPLSSEILLSLQNGNFVFPQIRIPTRQRAASCITENVLDAWKLKTICLFQPNVQNNLYAGEEQYMVVEARDPHWRPPAALSWVSRKRALNNLDSPGQADVLQKTLRSVDAHRKGTLPGPFARAGWIDELVSWAQEHALSRGLRVTGNFSQLNGGPFFSLIRLETNGPALWFKAVGEPNLHEYSITLGLARHYPKYLPEILASRPEWHGWLMMEVEGQRLDKTIHLEHWRCVTEAVARLQVECLGSGERLLEIGCQDRRVVTMTQQIEPFLDAMEQIMQQQPVEPPLRLNRFELKDLGRRLKNACSSLQSCGIPDSLIHGDLGPGNVIVNSENCVFLDWAEGFLGPPLLALEYLIAHLVKTKLGVVGYEQHLRRTYARRWAAVTSEERIYEAMRLTPCLAILWYAIASRSWQDPQLLQEEHIAKYFRSFTRRMRSEVNNIPDRELCPDRL